MTEALLVATRWAFKELRLHRIMANYQPRNERSGRLLERLGFVREGLAHQYLFIDGEWKDHVLTSLTVEAATEGGASSGRSAFPPGRSRRECDPAGTSTSWRLPGRWRRARPVRVPASAPSWFATTGS